MTNFINFYFLYKSTAYLVFYKKIKLFSLFLFSVTVIFPQNTKIIYDQEVVIVMEEIKIDFKKDIEVVNSISELTPEKDEDEEVFEYKYKLLYDVYFILYIFFSLIIIVGLAYLWWLLKKN